MSNPAKPTRRRSTRQRPVVDDLAAASESRRAMFRAFLVEQQLTPAGLAKRLGLKRPDVFDNFLNGHTDFFSASMLNRIGRAFPGTSLPVLLDPAHASTAALPRVAALACTGRVQPAFRLPTAEQTPFAPPPELALGPDLFGVRVRALAGETLYPDNTLLLCRPIVAGEAWRPGSRVVLSQPLEDGIEVTLRELNVRENTIWLWHGTTDPVGANAIIVPFDPAQGARSVLGDGLVIEGIVLASWQPEPGLKRP